MADVLLEEEIRAQTHRRKTRTEDKLRCKPRRGLRGNPPSQHPDLRLPDSTSVV